MCLASLGAGSSWSPEDLEPWQLIDAPGRPAAEVDPADLLALPGIDPAFLEYPSTDAKAWALAIDFWSVNLPDHQNAFFVASHGQKVRVEAADKQSLAALITTFTQAIRHTSWLSEAFDRRRAIQNSVPAGAFPSPPTGSALKGNQHA
jgi:hypothetical protein